MTDKTKTAVSELFDQALKNYEQAMKTGVKLQEESSKWWSNLLAQNGGQPDWQKSWKEITEQTYPAAQKRMEDFLQQIDQNSKSSLDLLKKAIDAGRTASVPEAQTKLTEMWRSSLALTQSNVESFHAANTRLFEAWSELVRKTVEPGSGKAK